MAYPSVSPSSPSSLPSLPSSSWGHSVTSDLVNWAFLETVIDPTDPFDGNGCWSGSATVLHDGRPAFLYTGRDTDEVQVKNVAFAKNPLLREWEKPSCNPIIPIPADVTNNNFRDPSTAWLGRERQWRMVVTAEVDGAGSALVYRSADFLRWERNSAPMHSSAVVPVLEYPDFFPVAEHSSDGLDTSANGAGVSHAQGLLHGRAVRQRAAGTALVPRRWRPRRPTG
ncbi:hypothetical protein E2562_021652 [Oryza meyeriana var. granulata]|uniref:beta-fructofuranosidase n=1 Tax=Oryza meyeriana var. granulata TaxID=110450 RepID=A0A6G1E019_9ORYZ|nr:hypothetical protein E2562_021652 [Oryza meyeriana var. granulata]